MQWCEARTDTGGMLSPIIANKRCFLDIKTQQCFIMEALPDEANVQQVGRYTFSANTFEWANKILLQNLQDPELKWLVLDEIGPLELQGKGLAPSLKTIFHALPPHLNLILVIREQILDSVLEFYDLNQYGVAPFHFPEK